MNQTMTAIWGFLILITAIGLTSMALWYKNNVTDYVDEEQMDEIEKSLLSEERIARRKHTAIERKFGKGVRKYTSDGKLGGDSVPMNE